MYKKTIGDIPLWQFNSLSGFDQLQHFVSSREGGVSKGEKGALNLSYQVGDNAMNVDLNRRKIASAMGIPIEHLVFPQQEHSNNVKVVAEVPLPKALACTDALITNKAGICIAVLAADCVPILLYDPRKRAVGAVHAGWRGTVGKVLTKTIIAMQESFNSNPADLKIGIGPSIGPEVYEVGESVVAAVQEAFPQVAPKLLQPQQEKGKALFNLWEANKFQLNQFGIPEENIEIAGICTLSNSQQFFSARASGAGGRFAAGILLNNPG